MAKRFRCIGCGRRSTVEGQRSWLTVLLSVLMFSFIFDMWFSYCEKCARKVNHISVFFIVLMTMLVIGVFVYVYVN